MKMRKWKRPLMAILGNLQTEIEESMFLLQIPTQLPHLSRLMFQD